MKFFYLLITLIFTFYYSSNSLFAKEEGLSDEIRADESFEDYKKRINKKTTKSIETIKVVASKNRESYNGQYIITQKMIQNSGAVSLADLLKNQPALYVSSNGDFGQLATTNLNGSLPQHVVILLDGVKLEDPSNAQPFFDIGQIPLSFIEEIEIIKGPSSVLYGSGAIAGVINIKTKKYQQNIATIKQEVGSRSSLTTQAGVNANIGKFNFTLFGNFFKTNGFSVSNQPYNGKSLEDDQSQVKDINLKLQYSFSEDTYIDSLFKISNSSADYDGFDTLPVDAEDTYVDKKENLYFFTYNFKVFSSFYNKIKFSQYTSKKRYVENFGLQDSEYFFSSKDQSFGYKGSYLSDFIDFQGGFDFEAKKMNNADQSTNDFAFYGDSKEYLSSNFSVEQGFRWNQNQRNLSIQDTVFNNSIAYNFALALDLSSDTFVKLNYGQSYRLPSLYELFSDYGNSNLNKETSKGINFEFSSSNFSSSIQQFQFNMFYNEINNMISLNGDYYSNIGNYTSVGFDTSFPFYIENFLYIADLKILPTYTYTAIKDKYSKINIAVIPKHKFSATFDMDIKNKYHISWNSIWASSTTNFINNTTYNLPSYFVNNVILSRNLSNSSKLYFRVDNIFNENYQTSYGYSTKGRSYYIGLVMEM